MFLNLSAFFQKKYIEQDDLQIRRVTTSDNDAGTSVGININVACECSEFGLLGDLRRCLSWRHCFSLGPC